MKPRLLDLFCGAGGAAMGYSRAGFEVVGVDIVPQENYPFAFYQADALEVLMDYAVKPWGEAHEFDAIHASPPCQKFSHGNAANDTSKMPDLIGPTRELLKATGLPYVIENVQLAPLINPAVCCGATLAFRVTDADGEILNLKRHRQFESNITLEGSGCQCKHLKACGFKVGGVYGGGRRNRWEAENVRHGGYSPPFGVQQRLMGIDWMTQKELNQAIPPAYTEFIGRQLIEQLKGAPHD